MRIVGIRQEDMTWTLQVINDTHNHGPSIALIAYPTHRIASLLPEIYAEIIRH